MAWIFRNKALSHILKKITLMLSLIAGVLWSVNIYRKLTAEQSLDTRDWLDNAVYILVIVILVMQEIIRRKERKSKQNEPDQGSYSPRPGLTK